MNKKVVKLTQQAQAFGINVTITPSGAVEVGTRRFAKLQAAKRYLRQVINDIEAIRARQGVRHA